jgi:glyoxylate reductase
LATSDAVSLHLPLTVETRNLIDARALARMKPTAYLINTARGPVINEAELVEALRKNVIAGAALDVYEFEPKMVPGLAELSNVVIAPHTASATRSSRSGMSVKAATNLLAMLKGERPPDCLNPEIYG